MTNTELADELMAKLPKWISSGGPGTWHETLTGAQWAQIIAALRAERPQSGEMVMVPREPTHHQIQLIFNTLMGELPEVKPDGWWGTSDQVAEAKKFYGELLAATEAERKS